MPDACFFYKHPIYSPVSYSLCIFKSFGSCNNHNCTRPSPPNPSNISLALLCYDRLPQVFYVGWRFNLHPRRLAALISLLEQLFPLALFSTTIFSSHKFPYLSWICTFPLYPQKLDLLKDMSSKTHTM